MVGSTGSMLAGTKGYSRAASTVPRRAESLGRQSAVLWERQTAAWTGSLLVVQTALLSVALKGLRWAGS